MQVSYSFPIRDKSDLMCGLPLKMFKPALQTHNTPAGTDKVKIKIWEAERETGERGSNLSIVTAELYDFVFTLFFYFESFFCST